MAATTEFSYTLTEDEVFRAMQKSGYYKTTGMRMVINSVLLGGFMVYFLVSFFLYKNSFNLGMAGVSLVVLLVVVFVPKCDMRRRARQVAAAGPMRVKITPQKLEVVTGEDQWIFPLNRTAVCKIIDDTLITITTKGRRLVVIPIAKIPEGRRTQVQSMLYEGTEST